MREMCGYGVLRSILVGAAVTLRNVAFESLFGLKWGEYGRYPTVVLKEKREALKWRLSLSLGMELGATPDFERMYVIKSDRRAAVHRRLTLSRIRSSVIAGEAPARGRPLV